jgi:hypothetical protein
MEKPILVWNALMLVLLNNFQGNAYPATMFTSFLSSRSMSLTSVCSSTSFQTAVDSYPSRVKQSVLSFSLFHKKIISDRTTLIFNDFFSPNVAEYYMKKMVQKTSSNNVAVFKGYSNLSATYVTRTNIVLKIVLCSNVARKMVVQNCHVQQRVTVTIFFTKALSVETFAFLRGETLGPIQVMNAYFARLFISSPVSIRTYP